MGLFFLKKLATFVLTLTVASVLIFFILEVLPGNAALSLLGADATPDAVATLTHKLGLDQSAARRYIDWIGHMSYGDFGTSYAYDTPVAELIGERLAVSLPLALLAMAIASALALSLGIFAASRHNRPADVGVMAASQLGMAAPNFWFAILLILFFAVQLRWFSAGGFPGWDAGFWPALRALVLPALSLATVQAAVLTRVVRSAILDVMREDFVRTARAKGLSRRATLWRHVLRNALVPIVTIAGLQFSFLIASAIVIENVFYLPGLGRLIFQSISNRDTIVVRDCVLLIAAFVIFVNFCVDLAYVAIDPRLRTA